MAQVKIRKPPPFYQAETIGVTNNVVAVLYIDYEMLEYLAFYLPSTDDLTADIKEALRVTTLRLRDEDNSPAL